MQKLCTPSNDHTLQSRMKPARTTDGDAGLRAANRVALRISSFKLPSSDHQSTRRGDADALNSVLNSCPSRAASCPGLRATSWITAVACSFFVRTAGRTLFACFVVASISLIIGAGFPRQIVTGHILWLVVPLPLPRICLHSADCVLLFSVISISTSASTPYGPSRGGCWPMMSDKVFAIRKEGEEPSRGETDIQCS